MDTGFVMITRSRIRDLGEDSDGEPRYEFDLHYRFRLADSEIYSGDRYSFDPRSPAHPELVRLVSTLTVGAQHTCFVDPENPMNSVMNRDVPIGTSLLGVCMMVMSIVVGYFFAREFGGLFRGNAWTRPEAQATADQQTLAASTAEVSALALSTSEAPEELASVHFSFILKYSSRPQVKLFVPEGGRPTVGRQCVLRWRFEDTLHHANFEMVLVGIEQAPPRRDAEDVEDAECSHRFFRETFFRSTGFTDVSEGTIEFFLPPNIPPTFVAEGYGIRWNIEVSGTSNGRDFKSAKALHVFPAATHLALRPLCTQRTTESATGTLALSIDESNFADETGTLRGQASWSLRAPCDGFEVRLFWYVRGKSAPEFGILGVVPFKNVERTGSERFMFTIPALPPPMEGKLFTLAWALELVAIGRGDGVRIDLSA